MLAIPEIGLGKSIESHNVDFDILCDWMEAEALFSDNRVSGSDIVDILLENKIYIDQDFAWEAIDNAFSIMEHRGNVIGESYPLKRSGTRKFSQRDNWQKYSSYSFCLTLSLGKAYPSWLKKFGSNYTTQGELFEELTAASVRNVLSGWQVHKTGWSRTAANKINAVVSHVAALAGEAVGNVSRWTRKHANEAGLDLLAFLPFSDGRAATGVLLFQCASGKDWKTKVKTPDLRIWTKVVDWSATPTKAFSMPFTVTDHDFRYESNRADGIFLDRLRLLSAGRADRQWLPRQLADDLNAWTQTRISSLPTG